jgi:hypothetical protein
MHTKDTIMAKIAKLRIQIAPVGYEIDRVVLPAKQEKADKVWLLVHENKSDDKATPFISKITTKLEKLGITVVEESHNRQDLFQIIRAVKSIIEKESDNDIYVNLASGSKIQAIGTMMACMMFNDKSNIHPFYVEAKEYAGFGGKTQLSTGIKEIQNVPPYSIKIPDVKLIKALKIIQEMDGKITKKNMAELAEKNNLISVNPKDEEHRSMVRFTSLDKNIIQPLEEWGFVTVNKLGRNRWINVTEEGKNASEFLI